MILYDYPKAPNPMRLRLFLYEKQINFKSVFIDLKLNENLSKKNLKINPWGTLPLFSTSLSIQYGLIYKDQNKVRHPTHMKESIDVPWIAVFRVVMRQATAKQRDESMTPASANFLQLQA